MITMPSHRSERLTLLYSRDEIAERVRELAAAIDADYAGVNWFLSES